MGVFDTPSDTRTPAERIADAWRDSGRAVSDYAASEYDKCYALAFLNPSIDPKAVFAALGTDAATLFNASNTTLAVGGKADRLKAIPARYTLTINPDGSITLTDVQEQA